MRTLPFDAFEAAFLDLVFNNQFVVLAAETGAGKSTRAPLALLKSALERTWNKIVVTEPRRPAARNLAKWVSGLHGSRLGETIGYQIGQDNQARDCKLVYMTEGILLAWMRSDPLLKSCDVIVLDEVHERGVNQDLLLALIKQVAAKRPDLKVVIMSATIDEQKFADYFGGAPILKVPGRTFPVQVRYADHDSYGLRDTLEMCADRVEAILRGGERGDILAFLPDQATIMALARDLEKRIGNNPNIRILPLYGAQAPEDQEAVFERGSYRRIILATNIAETSLTIDGVRHVVDTGLIKSMVYVDASMSALQITDHSRAGCDQRKGRAGRTQDGICWRLYTRASYQMRTGFTEPEINRMALDQVLLKLRCLGFSMDRVLGLGLMDPPSETQWRQAEDRLKLLGAIAANGEITKDGRCMDRFQTEPMIGRMLLEASKRNCLDEVVVIAAAFSATRQIFVRPKGKEVDADLAHPQFYVEGSDPLTYLKVWRAWRKQNRKQRDRWARERFLSSRALSQIDRIREQLRDILRRERMRLNQEPADPIKVGKAVASGLIDNLAVKGGRGYTWNDRETHIFPGSSVAKGRWPQLLVCAKVVSTSRAFMRGCHTVNQSWVDELIPVSARETMWRLDIPLFSGSPKLVAETTWRGLSLGRCEVETIPTEALPVIAQHLAQEVVAGHGKFHPMTGVNRVVWEKVEQLLGIRSWVLSDLERNHPAVAQKLTTAFLRKLDGVQTMQEIQQRALVLDLADLVEPEMARQYESQLAVKREMARERAEAELRERAQSEGIREELRMQVAELGQRLADIGVSLGSSLDWEERFLESDVRRAVQSGSGTEIRRARQLVERYRLIVVSRERRVRPKFEMTERIQAEVLSRFPVCPVCGGAWNSQFRCTAHHTSRRFVCVDGGEVGRYIGEFRTNRDERVAQLLLEGLEVHLLFSASVGRAWTGKTFKEISYQAQMGILPPELTGDHEEIVGWVQELREAEKRLEDSLAEVRRMKDDVSTGTVAVLTFTIRSADGRPVAKHGGVTYQAEYADEWPSSGERWFCQLGTSKQVGRARKASAKLIRKAEVYTSPEDVTEIREMLGAFEGLPAELIN